MYTQCPECGIAFKVTADVLKQAAGMVRCGGCGDAFNALAFLSETMPEQATASPTLESVPELKPETIETGSTLPRTISAEQSAALLKTLDELAGSDIRIEDTGVEWRVLDEDQAAEPAADDDFAGAIEPIAPEQTPVDELRFDDNTPLPDDFELDDEASYSPANDAAAAADDEADDDAEPVQLMPIEPATDIPLTEPDEWTDILGEFQDLADDMNAPMADVDEEAETSEVETLDVAEASDGEPLDDDSPDVAETSGSDPLDVDTQFALQAEAMGIDLSGVHAGDDIAAELEQDADEQTPADPEDDPALSLEDELDELDEAAAPDDVAEQEDVAEAQAVAEPDAAEEAAVADDELSEAELLSFPMSFEDELAAQLEAEQNDTGDDDLDALEEQVEPVIESHSIEAELEMLDDDAGDDDAADGDDHYVPPMTEEEHTVNMQIDQDLMALAIEDEDGFASTIVIADKNADDEADDEARNKTEEAPDEDAPGFETIIMEGDFVRSALDSEKREADIAAAAALAELTAVDDKQAAQESGGKRWGMVGGIVVLVLLLGVQMIHQSREALATIPAFSSSVGQIYRAIGQPIQPAWDITAWRIEASDDTIAAEEGSENLTIYSRIGNTSDRAMPYPLISISLTDRYLEPVGSQILDPGDYLPSDLDPRKHVEPGNTFNAVMSIEAPSIDATGYKLDVCYRLGDGRLSCAIDDFK